MREVWGVGIRFFQNVRLDDHGATPGEIDRQAGAGYSTGRTPTLPRTRSRKPRPRWGAVIRDLYQRLSCCSSPMIEKPAKVFHVYITASRARGVLYVGMTSDLAGRAWEHRERVMDGFTKNYWAGRLVYFERHETAASAAKRERLMKRWRRDWKIKLIEDFNPTWRDLFADAVAADGYEW
jgi:putative endonuclease